MTLDLQRGTIRHGDTTHSCYIARRLQDPGVIWCQLCLDHFPQAAVDLVFVARLAAKIAHYLKEGHNA